MPNMATSALVEGTLRTESLAEDSSRSWENSTVKFLYHYDKERNFIFPDSGEASDP